MSTVMNMRRRRFLTLSTAAIGAVGTAFVSVPFIASWQPSERARALGTSVIVDFSKLEPGRQITVEWRRQPVWVLRRTPEILEKLTTLTDRLRDPESQVISQQPKYAQNVNRSIKDEYLIVIGICTHLGCVPDFRPDIAPADLGSEWPGGYFCPCHGSRFDFAGRVFTGVPAPTNLVIPPHRYLTATLVEVGVDTKKA